MLPAGEANQVQPVESQDSPRRAALPPRRAVPLTFNPIINDEMNILAALSRGDSTIPELVEQYGTTMPAFSMWLMREDIQAKLATMTQAAACSIRIAGVNQLPKAVKAMAFQIESYIFDRTHNLIKPGLDADRVAATRDANVRKAAHLMLRLAKFDPSQPLYRRRERASDRRDVEEPITTPAPRQTRPAPATDELLQSVIDSGVLNSLAPSHAVEPSRISVPVARPVLPAAPRSEFIPITILGEPPEARFAAAPGPPSRTGHRSRRFARAVVPVAAAPP